MIATRAYSGDQEGSFLILYRACLAHYKIPAATPAQEARVTGLLNARQHMSCLMAYDGTAPVGFATWSLTFPARAGLALYMKELFVDANARGKGVGRSLLSGLIEIAEAEGCTRMDWQTDPDNIGAQAFYAGLQAPEFGKRSYRIDASEFSGFRARITGLGSQAD